MEHVLGTYRLGKIVLDERPDWPDGQRVAILPHLDGEPIGTILPRVELPDGRIVPFNGSREHFKLLADQMDRRDLPPPSDQEVADYYKSMEEMDRFYRDALKRRPE